MEEKRFLLGPGNVLMEKKDYRLKILPLFEEDLNGIIHYIVHNLRNPNAANNLVNLVEKAIYKRLPYADSFEPYRSLKKRKYPYYIIRVKNFNIFYVVIEDVMETRCILCNRRDLSNLL